MKKYHYFSHDFGARSDIKIKKLIVKHGYQGYGIYWAIVEDLYSNANALQADYDTIAFDLRADADLIKSIIEDFGLFKIKKDVISSDSVGRRLSEMNERSEKASKAANARWSKDSADASAMQAHSDSNAIKEKKGNKGKKENKEINNEDLVESFTNPYTPSEVLKLPIVLDSNGNKITLLSSNLEQRYKNLHSAKLVKEYFDYAVYSIRDKIASTEFADQRHYENWFIKLAPDERSISGKTKVVV